MIPQRISLVEQTVTILLDGIERHTWGEWLPSERVLCQQLKISRPTLRRALNQLKEQDVVQTVRSTGNRIIRGPNRRRKPSQALIIHLLCPDPLDRNRLQSNLWMDEVRDLLAQTGGRMILHHGNQYLRRNPDSALERLLMQNPTGNWILAHSSPQIQAWFQDRELPTVVAGYAHKGIDLPFVTIDNEAASRHAAGTFIRMGHRQIAFVHQKTTRAGDLLSAKGFEEAIAGSSIPGVNGEIAFHDGTKEGVCRAVQQLLRRKPPITAILVGTARNYATVASFLWSSGARIPADISLISREYETHLDAHIPQPSWYRYSPQLFGRRLFSAATAVSGANPREASTATQFIIPDYQEGDSVCRRNSEPEPRSGKL